MPAQARTPSRLILPAAVLAIALPFVRHFEGRELKPYRDIGGVLTVCDGYAGPDIIAGKTYTPAECDALTERSLYAHNKGAMSCVSAQLAPHVHASILSFTYNVGVANFCSSRMAKKLNAGDVAGACAEFMRWTFVQGIDCKDPKNKCGGIVTRRGEERALCEGNAPKPAA